MKNSLRFLFIVGVVFNDIRLGTGVPTTFAQTYPDRPIQLVVPGAAGSILDVAGRIVAEEMGKILGQPVVVVTKPGAGIYPGHGCRGKE